jgi:hypothetical protein
MQKVCPLGVAFRTHRLLAFTLHDLLRLATGPIPDTPEEWEGRMYGRLSVLPDQAQPLQRSQLMGHSRQVLRSSSFAASVAGSI